MIGRLQDFQRRLLNWYDRARRDLPWRAPPSNAAATPHPYHVLVSEAMLQQTQVATVIPYFHRFLKRFPTLADLAAADEQDVLRLWQGLGYYSRARNLRKAAQKVLSDHAGAVPDSVEALLRLPGVGRYTAGAIASLAFNRKAPILDGNVARVVCRLDKIEADPRGRETVALLWTRAEEILPRERIGDFNSALMELGAMVCIPRSPQCLVCPVNRHCEAYAAGAQARIPSPRKTKPTPLELRSTWCIRYGDRWLIEQRPSAGRWAGMWQFVTTPRDPEPRLPVKIENIQPLGRFTHGLTHRRYEFEAFTAEAKSDGLDEEEGRLRRWARLDELGDYPFPKPHLRIAESLAASPQVQRKV